MKYRNILIILLLCMGIYSYAQGEEIIRSGLYFSSHEVVQDKRTSLHLTPEKPFHFKKNFSVEFDARFREGDGYYGLIFRIIANENTNIDLISNLGAEGSNFWLVIKDEILFSFDFDEIPNSDFGNWITVATDVNIEKSTISVSFNDVKKERKIEEISALNKFDIVFGACSNPKFLNTDVSPMTLNNVQIYNNDKLYRHWKLSKHGFDAVYDEIKNEKGIVKNGIWLIDSHLKWEKQLSDNVVGLTGLCRDEEKGIVYLIAKDFMLSYNLITSKIDTIKYKEGHPFNNYYDCFIYNRQTNRIISYDLPEKLINEFDFETQTWQHNDFAYKEPDFAHHNKIISTNGDLITFGGYGHYKYKGVINVYDEKENTWNSENVSKGIYPRYMSAAGLSENNQWLILGGYGSKSGRQEISPEFFYDLHSIDLNTFEVKKINEYKTPEIPFVPCGTLIKTDSDSFLTLIYNSGNFNSFLQLAEFSINTPDYFLFPDSIPYNFSDIASWCMFFLHHESSRM
ncbi:hypothetical protein LJC11_05440, partial [Bacteroidales bacterium OttesenSCG-928-I21]|nr:hypothetical protein [Bacteroidales bacterium OttesenSCG-928-I21]